MITHLREAMRDLQDQNRELLDRFMSMVPDAAAQYQKMLMTHTLAANRDHSDGAVPLERVRFDNDVSAVDEFMQPFLNMGSGGEK